jgi:hypothetical protein
MDPDQKERYNIASNILLSKVTLRQFFTFIYVTLYEIFWSTLDVFHRYSRSVEGPHYGAAKI